MGKRVAETQRQQRRAERASATDEPQQLALESRADRRTRGRQKSSKPKKPFYKRPWPYIVLGSLIIVGALGASAAYVGTKAFAAKDELEAAIPLANTIKASLLANKPEEALAQLSTLQEHTDAAVAITNEPGWRVAEGIPIFGTNLTAVREAASIVSLVADDALEPVVELAGTIDISSFKPIDGQINLQPIIDAQDSVAVADDVIADALAQARAIDTSGTIEQVTGAVVKLETTLADTSETLGSVRTTVNLLPGMLGVDGPRNYLMIFQNNAEVRTLGGNPASLALLHVDNGRIDLVQQESSGFYSSGKPIPGLLDPATEALYGNNLSDVALTGYVQNITMIPDFKTTAILAKAIWETTFGTQIDAVISFDPVALSYLVGATGDVALSTGEVITADNAVQLLLSDVYDKYRDTADQDAFFAEAAKGVFDLVKSGKGDSKDLLDAMAKAVNEGRLMVWSAVQSEQDVIMTTDFSGILPLDNDKNTVVGVYFNDLSGSKLNYYLNAAVDVSAPICEADGGFTVTTKVALSSGVPADVQTLPPYVVGVTKDGIQQLDLVAIGPIGSTFDTFGDPNQVYLINQGIDKGRQVVRIRIAVPPGATSTAYVTMTAPPGEYGPLKVDTTPLVRPTALTTETC